MTVKAPCLLILSISRQRVGTTERKYPEAEFEHFWLYGQRSPLQLYAIMKTLLQFSYLQLPADQHNLSRLHGWFT